MKQVREASETAYQVMPVVEVMSQYLTYGIFLGAFLFVVGIVLVVRARMKAKPTVVPTMPMPQIETRVLAICPQCRNLISVDSNLLFCENKRELGLFLKYQNCQTYTLEARGKNGRYQAG